MNAAHDTSACLRLECWLSAYVDDELDAVHCLEVEAHLESCVECAERLDHLRATRHSLQSLSTSAPCALRERVALLLGADRLAEERLTEEGAPSSLSDPGVAVRTSERPPPSGIARLRLIVPLAAAATIALVFGAIELQKQDAAMESRASGSQTAVAAYSLDHLVEELVTQHIQSPPLDTTDPMQLNEYERHVGVRIREPHFHEAKWMGARVQPQSRAAMLRYMLKNQHRITVYMFDANRVSMASRRLVPVEGAPQHRAASKVYVGNIRGYTVAAAERDGVGYAVASDLSGDETAKLALAATR